MQKDVFERAVSVIRFFASVNDPENEAKENRRAFLEDIEALVEKWEIKEKL